MGDSISESSSSWTRDEFEYVNEVRRDKKEVTKGSIDAPNNEESVSAAVSLVVGSLRHGVVALCANIAHILREKSKLEQQVADLKQLRHNSENVSTSTSVNGSCLVHCQSPKLHNLQESLVTQRCDSAPASFIANGLKCLKSDHQSNVVSVRDGDSRHSDASSDCHVVCEPEMGECRTSSISMPEAHSCQLPKIINNVKRNRFSRGTVQTSTRSLNVCQNLPASSFVRRKYSTISLRRVRRSTTNRQKASSICSTSSINSYASCNNSEEHCRSSSNSSCIITVAEVHTPPSQCVAENKEGEAVKLLARTLTSFLQSDINEKDSSCNETQEDEVNCSSEKDNDQILRLPHPLAGCECFICIHLTKDQACQLYALTTEDGPLLPSGSTVLVEGERVGTVLYLGHEKVTTKNHSAVCPISVEDLLAQEGYMRPVGITLKLWAPDHGEIFVPLSAVICQLDENLDLLQEGSWSSVEYDFVSEDSDEENFKSEIDVLKEKGIPSELCNKVVEPLDVKPELKNADTGNAALLYDFFSRSPSVNSQCSVISHSLGDLSLYGLECEDVEFDRDGTFCGDGVTSDSMYMGAENIPEKFMVEKEILSSQESLLNTTFVTKSCNENSNETRVFHGSLYDTCDSAISLSFTKRLQYSEGNSGPSSVTDTGRESPQFGDTWDSGCSVGRRRCRSGSSGHYSDSESENHRLGNTFAKSLGDALNLVLEKHNIQHNWDFENYKMNEGNTNKFLSTDSSIHLGKDQETFQELHDFSQHNKSSPSPKFYINESVTGQSEV